MSHRGALRRENVGISSNKTGENPVHRKPKVSRATRIVPGLVGPKTRPKGVADGQQVNIPAPYVVRLTEGGTQEDSLSLVMGQVQACRLKGQANPPLFKAEA